MILLLPFALLWAALPNDGVALVADWFFQKVTLKTPSGAPCAEISFCQKSQPLSWPLATLQ